MPKFRDTSWICVSGGTPQPGPIRQTVRMSVGAASPRRMTHACRSTALWVGVLTGVEC
jgi:hypothetical protein